MAKNKKILTIIIAAVVVLAVWFFIRFVIGGPEDDWICDKEKDEWVKHGNPSATMPTTPCGEEIGCTAEAKLCPDGSAVGRTGPNCDFAPCPEIKSVKLYYYNPNLDKDGSGNIACSRKGLVSVERKIPITKTPIRNTINLLLKGKENLTEKDIVQGITTEYPLEGFSLAEANLEEDGTLILKFSDSLNKTSGGSCRVGILWFQIEATAKQFSEVLQVRFLPEEIFQP